MWCWRQPGGACISRRRLSYAVIKGVPQPQLVSHNHRGLLHRHCGSGWLSRKAVLHVPLSCHCKGREPPPSPQHSATSAPADVCSLLTKEHWSHGCVPPEGGWEMSRPLGCIQEREESKKQHRPASAVLTVRPCLAQKCRSNLLRD